MQTVDEKHKGKKKRKNKAERTVDKLTENKNEVSKVDAFVADDNTEKKFHKKIKRSESDGIKVESLTSEDDTTTDEKSKSEKVLKTPIYLLLKLKMVNWKVIQHQNKIKKKRT